MESLNTDAAFASCSQEISKEAFLKNNIAIREIHVDDLFELEKDLAFYDKVFL